MIDLNKQARIAKNNAIRRCIPLDDRSVLKHLQSELAELIDAEPMKDPKLLKEIANTKDDIRFIFKACGGYKDSNIAEAIDVIVNTLTYLDCQGVDIETAFMITQRINSIRRD